MWIHRIQREFNRARRAVQRIRYPLRPDDLLNAVRGFGEPPTDSLLVHSSLSACGQVRGGAVVLLQSWRQWIGDRNLIIPTHTYSYPDQTGQTPIFDPRQTPSVIGVVSDYFWRQPGVKRSLHPTHSLACEGTRAEELCRGHEQCDTPCGPGTPYERFVEHDGSILMFGASMNTYTLFYTAMHAAQVPYLYLPEPCTLKVRHPAGEIQDVVMRRQDVSVPRRFAEMDVWLEKQGLLVRRALGMGELFFIPHAGEAHCHLVETLRRDPLFLVAEEARATVAKRFGL